MERGAFIKNTIYGGVAATCFSMTGNTMPQGSRYDRNISNLRLKDYFRIWEQDTGNHHVNNAYNLSSCLLIFIRLFAS